MSEYVITSLRQPPWRLDAGEFVARIQQQWPGARTEIGAADAPMAANALIPFSAPRRELGVALDQLGFAVILEPADPDTATEFVMWYLQYLPAFAPEVRLITEDYDKSMPLHPETTADEIRALLEGPR